MKLVTKILVILLLTNLLFKTIICHQTGLELEKEQDFEEKLEKFTDHYNSVRPHKKLRLC